MKQLVLEIQREIKHIERIIKTYNLNEQQLFTLESERKRLHNDNIMVSNILKEERRNKIANSRRYQHLNVVSSTRNDSVGVEHILHKLRKLASEKQLELYVEEEYEQRENYAFIGRA